SGASMYVCHSSSWQREFQNAMESAGFEARCQIIWAKNTFAWGFGRYKFQHEPIFIAMSLGKKMRGMAISPKRRCGRKRSPRPIVFTRRRSCGVDRARPGQQQ